MWHYFCLVKKKCFSKNDLIFIFFKFFSNLIMYGTVTVWKGLIRFLITIGAQFRNRIQRYFVDQYLYVNLMHNTFIYRWIRRLFSLWKTLRIISTVLKRSRIPGKWLISFKIKWVFERKNSHAWHLAEVFRIQIRVMVDTVFWIRIQESSGPGFGIRIQGQKM